MWEVRFAGAVGIDMPELKLVDFLSGDQTVSVMNDPVMGGQSHSTYDAKSGDFTGAF